MFDLASTGDGGHNQNMFRFLMPEDNPTGHIIDLVQQNKLNHAFDLPYSGEAFYEAAGSCSTFLKARLLQEAFVRQYHYAAFELAELIFKGTGDIHKVYKLSDALHRYEAFIKNASHELETLDEGDILAQKLSVAIPEAHFKCANLYFNNHKAEQCKEFYYHWHEALELEHPRALEIMESQAA